MDPELLAAIREYLATKRALPKGVTVTPDDEEEFFRVKTGGKFGRADALPALSEITGKVTPGNLARSALQGVSLGFLDELVGKLPEALGGGAEARDITRLQDEEFKAAHPAGSFVGELAGGLLPAILSGGGSAAGSTLPRAIGRGVLTGAAAGAVSGAGHAEGDLQDRLPAAGMGAVGGAVLGGLIPAGIGAAKYVRSPARRGMARIQEAIQKSGGPDAAIAKAQDYARLGRGDEVRLPDALGDHGIQAADFAANNSDDALIAVNKAVKARQVGQSERLLSDVRELGGDYYAPEIQDQLEKSRRAWAASDAGYEGLRQANKELAPTVTASLKRLLTQPRVKETLQAAKQDGLIGEVPDIAKLSFSHLQDVAESLDDASSAAFRKGKGNLGTRLAEAHQLLRDEMRARVPGYAAVDAEYAQRKALENAVELGKAAWNDIDTRGFQTLVSRMTPDEKEVLRKSMVSEAIAKLRSAATNRDEAKRIVDLGQAMQDKLRLAFGSKENFQMFMERAQAEAELARLKGAISGPSTARRLQQQGYDPAEAGADAAAQALTHPQGLIHHAVSAVARGVARRTTGAVARRTAAEMTPLLMTQGSDEIERLIRSLTARDALVGRPSSQAAPMAISSALAGLLSPR